MHEYRFRSVWKLGVPPDRVFDELADLSSYPEWWREVRGVDETGEHEWRVRVRSFLPYDLVFTTRATKRDGASGVIEASLAGDVDGFSRWTVEPDGDGTRAVFEEEVEARKSLLRRLAVAARPAFILNHGIMMRNGRRGLLHRLQG